MIVVQLDPDPPAVDFGHAKALADDVAVRHLGDPMLLSWYDRDRDFESPRHASECQEVSAVPGFVDYAVHHGATLKIDVHRGRFVFFYLPVDL